MIFRTFKILANFLKQVRKMWPKFPKTPAQEVILSKVVGFTSFSMAASYTVKNLAPLMFDLCLCLKFSRKI